MHDLAVPNRSQRIAPSAAARCFLRRQPRILFDAIGSGSAEPGLGRGNSRRLGLAETHVQPHLAIGDVAAGQAAVPHWREDPLPIRPTATARKHGPLRRGRADRQIRDFSRLRPPFPRDERCEAAVTVEHVHVHAGGQAIELLREIPRLRVKPGARLDPATVKTGYADMAVARSGT